MSTAYSVTQLVGVNRAQRRFVFFVRDLRGVGFIFGCIFLGVGAVARLLGRPVPLQSAFSRGGALAGALAVVLILSFVLGIMTGRAICRLLRWPP